MKKKGCKLFCKKKNESFGHEEERSEPTLVRRCVSRGGRSKVRRQFSVRRIVSGFVIGRCLRYIFEESGSINLIRGIGISLYSISKIIYLSILIVSCC